MMPRFLAPSRSPSRASASLDPLSDLQREMGRLFDDFLGGGVQLAAGGALSAPRMDVREGQNEISVCAELPGVKPEAVEIRIDGNLLMIRGEKTQDTSQEQGDYHLMERSYGRFQRTLQLPYVPEPEQVNADFRDGVLTIHVPKSAQQERSRRIEIHTPDQGTQPAAVGSSGAGTVGGVQPH